MKVSVERLRWGLAGGLVLLLVAVSILVLYGRYTAARDFRKLLDKSGIQITQGSDNVTWSQSVRGRTLYTMRMKKVIPHQDDKYTLRGVTILLYGKDGKTTDRLEGDEFEYDRKAGVAKAAGVVTMAIQLPGPLQHREMTSPSPTGSNPEENVIHVVTSGLVYLQNLGVAATPERVEFHYGDMTCTAKGAEFNTNDNELHLLADVEAAATFRQQPVTLRASRADLDRNAETVKLAQAVAVSHGRSVRSTEALLTLRRDGSLQAADLSGDVEVVESARHLRTGRLQGSFNEDSLPRQAALSGGVVIEGSAASPLQGNAQSAELRFTTAGVLEQVVANGGVLLSSETPRPGAAPLTRSLHGQQITAQFIQPQGATQPMLTSMHASGAAGVRGESLPSFKGANATRAEGVVTTQMSADDIVARFDPRHSGSRQGESTLRQLNGTGHTHLEQDGLAGAQQISNADAVEASFAPDTRPNVPLAEGRGGTLQIVRAVQTGHVQLRDQAAAQGVGAARKAGPLSFAHAERAVFDRASDRLTLSGGAAYQQGETNLSADSIALQQSTGNAAADGHVEAALSAPTRDATHVLGDHATLVNSTKTADFTGTDAHPARLWQGSSQITAASLYMDQAHETLAARPASPGGSVSAVFATAAANDQKREPAVAITRQPSGGGIVHVSSAALDYSGARREAVCTGGVRAQEADMQVRAQQAVIFLAAPPKSGSTGNAGSAAPPALGGSLERVVFTGGVRLQAPGRAGDGGQMVYTAGDGNYTLTGVPGSPARVADSEQGVVTGASLVLNRRAKSVIVTGSRASNGDDSGSGRVHTEVPVRTPER